MSFRTKAIISQSICLVLALGFPLLFGLRSFGDIDQSSPKVVPQDLYELHFLGCKIKRESSSQTHEGLFVFIWKGQNATKILAYSSLDKKAFLPFPSFSLHREAGWKSVGAWCGTGSSWEAVQPGQVITFSIDMGWIERDEPGCPTVKDADSARLNLISKDGDITSDEFSLPLLPQAK